MPCTSPPPTLRPICWIRCKEIPRDSPSAASTNRRNERLCRPGHGNPGRPARCGEPSPAAEDLRSPCTEEIAVFRAFARTVAAAREGFVILDTAPTGHTLLLLDTTEAYHRELGRQSRDTIPEDVRTLLAAPERPGLHPVILVTLPEATPVHEAAELQKDLPPRGPSSRLAGSSTSASHRSTPAIPFCNARASNELPFLAEVTQSLAKRSAMIHGRRRSLSGAAALGALFSSIVPLPFHENLHLRNHPVRLLRNRQALRNRAGRKLARPDPASRDREAIRRVMIGRPPLAKATGDCCGGTGCC